MPPGMTQLLLLARRVAALLVISPCCSALYKRHSQTSSWSSSCNLKISQPKVRPSSAHFHLHLPNLCKSTTNKTQPSIMKTSFFAVIAFAASFVYAGPIGSLESRGDCQVTQYPNGAMCCLACGCPSPDNMSCRVCRMSSLPFVEHDRVIMCARDSANSCCRNKQSRIASADPSSTLALSTKLRVSAP
ncbi:hypothetical protein V8F06_010945 [Rhypophila decipiens]